MDLGTLLFVGGVAVWSAIAAYFLVVKVGPMLAGEKGGKSNGPIPPVEHAGARGTATHPELFQAPPPTPSPAQVPETSAPDMHDGFKTFATGSELTVEDIIKGLSRRS